MNARFVINRLNLSRQINLLYYEEILVELMEFEVLGSLYTMGPINWQGVI